MRGFRITTAWVTEDGENPWLLSAYDEYTEDSWNGQPDFFAVEVEKATKNGADVRVVNVFVEYSKIEALFAAGEVEGDVRALDS